MLDYFEKRIPRIKIIRPQGTYLIWLDCRELGLDDQSLKKFMCEKAKVGLDDGFVFGEGGSGFERMNIACPRPLLEEALGRIEKAVRELNLKVALHICCAVCAAGAAERLIQEGHQVYGFFYNPNIYPEEEYRKRLESAQKVALELKFPLQEGPYEPAEWDQGGSWAGK